MTTANLRARVALAELEALVLTVEDLLAVAGLTTTPRPGPTLAAYLPGVRDAYPPRTRRTYDSYWRLAEELIGDVPLEKVTSDHVAEVADEAARRARARRVGSDGRASRESTIAAVRVFTRAHKAGLVASNPALQRFSLRVSRQVPWPNREAAAMSPVLTGR